MSLISLDFARFELDAGNEGLAESIATDVDLDLRPEFESSGGTGDDLVAVLARLGFGVDALSFCVSEKQRFVPLFFGVVLEADIENVLEEEAQKLMFLV